MTSTISLLDAAHRAQPATVEMRRALHRVPEIGNHLPKSKAIILDNLAGLGLEIHEHQTTSGVAAVLRGARPGPTVLLRGDFDGLELTEETGLAFASEHPGHMHACGHDLHVSMLAATARLLAERRADFGGQVLFMFQPGEEGYHGARFMLDEGLLDMVEPSPSKAFAIHVSTKYERGTIHIKAGAQMAAADRVRIVVHGKGGHASSPHFTLDPIPVAAEILLALEVAVTRQVDVADPAVITFGRFQAGTAYNVVPETAELLGTIRTLSKGQRDRVNRMIGQVSQGVAAAHGLSVEVEVDMGYPPTINHADVVDDTMESAVALFGSDKVIPMEAPIMGAEDWSYVLQRVPGAMAFLGAAPGPVGESPVNHSNRVIFDESVMPAGVALYMAMALRYLD